MASNARFYNSSNKPTAARKMLIDTGLAETKPEASETKAKDKYSFESHSFYTHRFIKW